MAGADEVYYEVGSLLDKRIGEGLQVEYLVHWKGFTDDYDTWEPADNLGNCKSQILKFERQWKKRKESTQKYVQKLVNKSKMARFDQNKVISVKANTKRERKKVAPEAKRKKSVNESLKKSVNDSLNLTLDDVFESVIEGKTASVKKKTKESQIKRSSTDKNLPGSPIKRKKSSSGSIDAGSKTTPGKLSSQGASKHTDSSKKEMSRVKAVGSVQKRASTNQDSAKKTGTKVRINVKVKKKVENSPKSGITKNSAKKAGDKRWCAVDEEVSFCSDDDASPGPPSTKKSKKEDSVEKTQKPKKMKMKLVSDVTKSSKTDTKQVGKVAKSSLSKHNSNISGKLITNSGSPKSAFKVVSKKKNAFKISVNHLVGASKKLETGRSDSESKKGLEVKVNKKTLKALVPKIKNDKNVVTSIQTDDETDSDCEILYSLSDTSDLAINDLESSQIDKTELAAGRSKSEGSMESSVVKKDKKALKKSKSTSEHVDRAKNTKKIKLIDSLKQISPTSIGKLVRPVSPTPVYTTVKHTDGTLPPDTQPLLAQPQWVIDDDVTPSTAQSASLPMSPASMSYKDLLENLPSQLHPKNKKKHSGSEDSSDIERRISVRASECAFKYKDIVIKKCQKYTQIWLNTHTKMKNALNPSVMQEISAALNASKYDDSTLVMFSGLGNVFCSGIDLHYLTVGDRKVACRKMADALRDLVRKFITFPKLIVAVVTGPAIGMGSALLPLCDIVYASDKATFYMPYAQLSQTPECCASFTLPNIVGTAMANELLIGGRKLTAIEACQLGFVSQVYWPTSMMQEVIPRVQHMALLSGKVLETTKLLMRSHQRTKLDLTNESECNLLMERWSANECQRAIEEFLSNEKNYML